MKVKSYNGRLPRRGRAGRERLRREGPLPDPQGGRALAPWRTSARATRAPSGRSARSRAPTRSPTSRSTPAARVPATASRPSGAAAAPSSGRSPEGLHLPPSEEGASCGPAHGAWRASSPTARWSSPSSRRFERAVVEDRAQGPAAGRVGHAACRARVRAPASSSNEHNDERS